MHSAAPRTKPFISAFKNGSPSAQEVAPDSVSPVHSERSGLRIEFLDGFRSIMALMVLLWHACSSAQNPPAWLKLFASGFWHVSAFFVLSGFILYLPSAGRDRIEVARPFAEYMRRRIWRLAPPYYVAIILSFLVPFVLAKLSIISSVWSSPHQVSSYLWHLTFLHTWSDDFWLMTNSSCWMLGYEWVLSLCFPFFIYIARKFGWAGLLTLVVLLRITYPEPLGGLLRVPFHATYTFCFVSGILAARLARRQQSIAGLGKKATGYLLLIVFLASIGTGVFFAQKQAHTTVSSWLIGLALASFLAFLSYVPTSLPARFLSVRPLKVLSVFTYSLFLVNSPLLELVCWIARKCGLTGSQEFYLAILPSLPAIIALAYVFHRLFERPITQMQTTRKENQPKVSVTGILYRGIHQFQHLLWLIRSCNYRVAGSIPAEQVR